MRFAVLTAIALATSCLAAHADTFDFTFQGVYVPQPMGSEPSPTLTFSFQLTGLPIPYLYDAEFPSYKYASVPVTSSVPGILTYSTFLTGPSNLFNLDFASPSTLPFYTINEGLEDVYGLAEMSTSEPVYTGSKSQPTFLPGSYQASFEQRVYTDYAGVLTITDVTAATPEPSGFILLGTGLMGLGAVVRRRFASC